MEVKPLDAKYAAVLHDLEKLIQDGISISGSSSLTILAKLPGVMEDLKKLVVDLRIALS